MRHDFKPCNPRITCVDGFSLSVQGSEYTYCSPREDSGPYWEVEVGFPSADPGLEIMRYCENRENPTETVYGYVPVDVVDRIIAAHGGIKGGKMP